MSITVRSPATGEVVGQLNETSPASLPSAIEKARQAQKVWAGSSPAERKGGMKKLQALLLERSDMIARVVSSETGRPLQESLNVDIMASLAMGRHCIDKADELMDRRPLPMGQLTLLMRSLRRRSYILPQPAGVVLIISPWNYPFAIPFTQTAQALTAGDAVVIKPSSRAPLSALEIERMCRDAGLPDGLVQVVVGHGDTLGESLLGCDVDRIIFTGSEKVGRHVASIAGDRLIPCVLELGGKDPLIVLPGADLERAAQAAVWASFVNAGQTCGAVKRLLLHESVSGEFLERFQANMAALKIGDGLADQDVSVGPLIDVVAMGKVEKALQTALAQGAILAAGGRSLGGSFFQPTLLTGVTLDMDIAEEEVFGPLVVAMVFKEDEEAVLMANSASHALNASVWGERKRAMRLAAGVRAGTVAINNVPYTYGIPTTPWGGPGASGGGRTHGTEGFDFLLELKHVHEDRGSNRDPWWHPYSKRQLQASHDLTDLLFRGKIGKAFSLLRRR
jgi:succinate-semialdehyde dehydrogenase/glutarate-semialdehyde dehydrogenase